MNTVNFIDGLDGLAGGVAFIAGVVLFVNSAFRLGQTSVSLLHLALMGAALGFTLYNFYPARIFMGSGAVTLGYILGALAIIGGAKMATILFVVGLPLLDTVWQAATGCCMDAIPFRATGGICTFACSISASASGRSCPAIISFARLFGVLTLVVESQLFKFIALTAMLALVAVGMSLVSRRQARAVEVEKR